MPKINKPALDAAPKKRGAPNKLGPEPVVQTIRLPKELFQGVVREKAEREIAGQKNISFSATILSMIEASMKASDRRRAKAKAAAEKASEPGAESARQLQG